MLITFRGEGCILTPVKDSLGMRGVFEVVKWLKLTLFIVLYPVGYFGELMSLIKNYGLIRERRPYSVFMPNGCNFSFDIMVVVWLYIIWGVGEGGFGDF
jgi:bacteriorhodopsin